MSKQKQAIQESQFRYKKGLGQNFIYDEALLQSLVYSTGLGKDDRVLEIGPGMGTLTKCLAEECGRVISLEIDEKLLPMLAVTLEKYPNAEVRLQDVMTADLPAIAEELGSGFSVVANIPYYITTPILTRLLDSRLPLKMIAVMVQKEVAEKILACPGEENYGPMAIKCQYYCEPEITTIVEKEHFTPVPKVDSAFVLLPLREHPLISVDNEDIFFKTVHAAFLMRRKTMANNLTCAFEFGRDMAIACLTACGLDERVRGEQLSIEEMGRLSDAINARIK